MPAPEGLGSAGRAPHSGPGGGRSGYVYGLTDAGVEVLSTHAGTTRTDIPIVADPATFVLGPRYVKHQPTVSRCLLAIRRPAARPASARISIGEKNRWRKR